MSTPIGHTLVGLTIARRLGVRSRTALAACVIGASLPDADVIAGALLHGDGWELHRKQAHTLGFAAAAGALAGLAGVITTRRRGAPRDVPRDVLTGALIVSSHVALDEMWFPYPPVRWSRRLPSIAGPSSVHWLADLVAYGAIAWRCWPRGDGAVNDRVITR